MDNPLYVMLSRQTALLDEMQNVASNIAHMSTTGYRREASVFSEHVHATDGPAGSVSHTTIGARYVDTSQGALTNTGGTLDLAIQGDGYFLIETPDGERLTRAGAFATNPENELVTAQGLRVLDPGGGPVFLPPDGGPVEFGPDGSISVNGELIGQLGLVTAAPETLHRDRDTLLNPTQGFQPAGDVAIAQGFVEASNVNAIDELTRMIEVQRTYEAGQNLLQQQHDTTTQTIQTLARPV